jgi:hypothetical protein
MISVKTRLKKDFSSHETFESARKELRKLISWRDLKKFTNQHKKNGNIIKRRTFSYKDPDTGIHGVDFFTIYPDYETYEKVMFDKKIIPIIQALYAEGWSLKLIKMTVLDDKVEDLLK